jgi:hypothetical protein
MEKLFQVAYGINNPYALAALGFLVLFFLFKGVLTKVGLQRGKSGTQVLMKLMNLVAILAGLTVLAALAFKAYEVYRGGKVVSAEVNAHTAKAVSGAVAELKAPDLQVEYALSRYGGASLLIGNRGQGVELVSDLSLHWTYAKCPVPDPMTVGAYIVTYRYVADVTTSDGSKRLDDKTFKYGPGEVDEFKVDVRYPADGVYRVWMSFAHKTLGEPASRTFVTERAERRVCEQA